MNFFGIFSEFVASKIFVLLCVSDKLVSSNQDASSVSYWNATKDVDFFELSLKQYTGLSKSVWYKGRDFLAASFKWLNCLRCSSMNLKFTYPFLDLSVWFTSSVRSAASSEKLGMFVRKNESELMNFLSANRFVGGGIARNPCIFLVWDTYLASF